MLVLKLKFDEEKILYSTGALSISSLPKKMIVIGGGYIGLEMGSVWSRLGTEVQVIEFLDHITPGMDKEISIEFLKILQKQGIKFELNTKVEKINKSKDSVIIETLNKDGKKNKFEADVVLISVGRKPFTKNLNLEKIGVEVDKKGRIKVNKNFETNAKNVYAIGDVAGPPMLAHKAEHEGVICIEKIAGLDVHPLKKKHIPSRTYGRPQLASVGITETTAKQAGYELNIGRFPFIGNGKAIALGEPDGMIKTIFDKKTGELLGAHMVGAEVTELIRGYVIAMGLETTEEELLRTIFPHPTLSEMMHESVLNAYNRAIHI